MRFAAFAIGTLIHSQSNKEGYVSAFSAPKFRPQISLTNGLGRGSGIHNNVLKSSRGLPDGFDANHDLSPDEEINSFHSSIVQPDVDR